MIVVDAGPLVAAALDNDINHKRCVALLTRLHASGRPLVVPWLVVTEVCYLLEREAGSRVEADFLRSLRDGDFLPVAPTVEDLDRMAGLVDQYADLPLGSADASVVALAERLGVTEIATLDRRHFSVVRSKHAGSFTLLPD